MSEIEVKLSDVPVCDFCASTEPAWEYDAGDFINMSPAPAPAQKSLGGWLACDSCAGCIEKSDWRGLAARGVLNPSAKMLIAMVGRDEAINMMMKFHVKFRSHRKGNVVRYERGA